MSGTEALMWVVDDDPALRSDFLNITLLDTAPDRSRMRAKVERAVVAIPRLRQRVAPTPLNLMPPEWVDDPHFDLDNHLRFLSLPSPGDERALLDLCADLSLVAFDKTAPCWEFTVIEGCSGGRAALVQKVHHAVIDGVGGLRLSLSIVDAARGADAPAAPAPPGEGDPIDRGSSLDALARGLEDASRQGGAAVRAGITRAAHLATHPREAADALGVAVGFADSLRRQLFDVGGPHSELMSARSTARHFELHDVDLPAAHTTAKRLGGTINDLYVSAIVGALGHYHHDMGSACDQFTMAMPVSLRGREEQGGNRFAPVRAVVPAHTRDARARFDDAHALLAGLRSEPSIGAVDGFADAVARVPASLLRRLARSQTRGIDVTTSNLRGSPVPLYLAGAKILATYPMGPRVGTAVNATVISYDETLCVGFNIDPAAITDTARFMDCVNRSFKELLAL